MYIYIYSPNFKEREQNHEKGSILNIVDVQHSLGLAVLLCVVQLQPGNHLPRQCSKIQVPGTNNINSTEICQIYFNKP